MKYIDISELHGSNTQEAHTATQEVDKGERKRVYEIAREAGLSSKELLARLPALGIEAGNHMTALGPEEVTRIRRAFPDPRCATKQLDSTVPRRRAARSSGATGAAAAAPEPVDQVAPEAAKAAMAAARVPAVPRAASAPAKDSTAPTTSKSPAAPVRRAAPAASGSVTRRTSTPPASAPRAVAEERPAPERALGFVRRRVRPVQGPVQAPDELAQSGRSTEADTTADMLSPQARAAEAGRAAELGMAGARAAAEQAVTEHARHGQGPGGQWAFMSPRERFERELDEARKRADERAPIEEPAQTPAGRSGIVVRSMGRPAVGDVIALPRAVPRDMHARGRAGAGHPGGPHAATAAVQAPARPNRRIQPGNGYRSGKPGWRPPGKAPLRRPAQRTQLTMPAEHKRVIKIHDNVSVSELARNMSLKSAEVLAKLWAMGMTGININALLDPDTAGLLAGEFGYEIRNVAFREDAALDAIPDQPGTLVRRAPVVTVMGHVDHGKTTLLDAIRTTRVAAGEAGGITQHIAAYRVEAPGIGAVVFLDTPGHEAFTAMRARGAQVTDLVVLVVAANDGVMPQTLEALGHARAAGVPVVVAVNKSDAPDAQPDRVRQQLSDHGLIPDTWGGETLYVNVSALQRTGIDELIGAIALQAELLDLRANPDKPAIGAVIEASLDRARGPLATILVQQGTLRVGDTIVVGEHLGKVRAMLDDKGAAVTQAGPSSPVQVLGLDGVPDAGETVNVTDDRTARQLVEHRVREKRQRQIASLGRVSLESMMDKIKRGETLTLGIVLKADVHGSAEALAQALTRLSTSKVKVHVVHAGVGGVTESDVNLARAGGAIIVGFSVRPAGKAAAVAKREGVEIRLYDVIYDALDDIRQAMTGMLPPVRKQRELGKAEVRNVFRISRVGMVAGCMVTDGQLRRGARARLVRDAVKLHEGSIADLKRFQEDVTEVAQGYECGIRLDGTNDIRVGDVIEVYDIVEEAQSL